MGKRLGAFVFLFVTVSSSTAETVRGRASAPPADPVLNEFVFNHTGTDFNEFVEIFGAPNTSYFNIWVVQLEGDLGGNPGTVDAVFRFGTSAADGFVTTNYQVNRFENGTSTALLVENFSGARGDDLDFDDDGVLDEMPWDRELDAVAVSDGSATDVTYAAVVLEPGLGGNPFTVGGASRVPDGNDTGSTTDWVRNDFNNEGIPGFNGGLDPVNEALNTPADTNRRNYSNGGGDAPAGLRIHDIQGRRHRSSFEGQNVLDVPGVVTAVDNSPSFARGFYMQEPDADNDARTSEGIFVLTGGTNPTSIGVAVGLMVEVDGVVEENRPAANAENLTITRLRSNDDPDEQVRVLGGGATITPAELRPPRSLISTFDGHIEDARALRNRQGLGYFESFEGMLVSVPDAVTVARTSRFGEMWVVAEGGSRATGMNPRGGITIRRRDFNPERIQIDDGILFNATPDVDVGAELGDVVGVMSYDFENYEIDALAPILATPNPPAPEVTSLTPDEDRLAVATFNVRNLTPFAGSRFDALAEIIVRHLGAPDILGLQEIQDNNGSTNDGMVAADETYARLINAIEAFDSSLTGAYAVAQIDPENNRDGGQPGGNIRVGFLYNADRVALAPGTPGDAVTPVEVGAGPSLSVNPGRILDTEPSDGDAFASSRKPLVAHFVFNEENVFVVVNHFNSKGGDQPLFGPSRAPALTSETQRVAQAEVVRAFADELLAEDRGARLIVLGDFNDFGFSMPLRVLRGSGRTALTNLMSKLRASDRYTFAFDGNSQPLDTILINRRYRGKTQFDAVHVNTEYFSQASDHDPLVMRLRVP